MTAIPFDGEFHSRDRPELFAEISDTGSDLPLDLAAYRVKVIATNNATSRTYDAAIVDSANGIVSFRPTKLETIEPGFLELHFVAYHFANDTFHHSGHSKKLRFRVREPRVVLG